MLYVFIIVACVVACLLPSWMKYIYAVPVGIALGGCCWSSAAIGANLLMDVDLISWEVFILFLIAGVGVMELAFHHLIER